MPNQTVEGSGNIIIHICSNNLGYRCWTPDTHKRLTSVNLSIRSVSHAVLRSEPAAYSETLAGRKPVVVEAVEAREKQDSDVDDSQEYSRKDLEACNKVPGCRVAAAL